MTKFSRTANGKYSVAGKTYDTLIGTRAQVWHGTAYKTTGGLTHAHLMKNKSGRIVSKSKHLTAKKEKRLVKAGYVTKKGHFGFVKKSSRKSSRKMSGGTGNATGTGFPNASPIGRALSSGGSRRRRHGGSGINHALSPSSYDGKGVGTSGVDVQFQAGLGN
jgi:hypothetical protein